eukprot:1027984-Amphidinium_carterae.1
MEDVCRQEVEKGKTVEESMPHIFFTIAPVEWTFPVHEGMFFDEPFSEQQTQRTLHLHIEAVLLANFFNSKPKDKKSNKSAAQSLDKVGIARLRNWSIRFEFQSRGTIHLHGVMWADSLPNIAASSLTGRSGEKHCSGGVA